MWNKQDDDLKKLYNKIPQLSREHLRDMYRQIPKFKCEPGCTDCCGPVPWSRLEWDSVPNKRAATNTKCPYAHNGCDVYEHRPLMCRLFGAVNARALTCPHGYGPDFPLAEDVAKEMLREYNAMMLLDMMMDKKGSKEDQVETRLFRLTDEMAVFAHHGRTWRIPRDMYEGIEKYINHGTRQGSFLTAVFENDFVTACLQADHTNVVNLPAYALFLRHYAPPQCHGSAAKVKSWRERFTSEKGE